MRVRVASIHVRGFRSIRDDEATLDDLTVLVGANGAGKSALLHSLRHFYEGGAGTTEDDFYNREIATPIEIAVAFADLTADESSVFGGYLQDGNLQVMLRIEWLAAAGGGGSPRSTYHGWLKRHEAFESVRTESSAAARLTALRQLVAGNGELYDFTPENAWGRAEPQIAAWESAHPEHCSYQEDDGSFFRAPNTRTGPLAPFTELIFVPAVREAADEGSESRSNTIGRMVALVIGDVTRSEEIEAVGNEFRQKYGDVMRRREAERLPVLQEEMTKALGEYVPGASVSLTWEGANVSLVPPRTFVRLEDDGFVGGIEGKGHGLQRLFIVSLLQVASALRAKSSNADEAPAGGAGADGGSDEPSHCLLVVEEPELYQHPMQARRFAAVLARLAAERTPAFRTQVIYSTHSPIFVGIDRFDSIRLARKTRPQAEFPSVTHFHRTQLAEVMASINSAFGREQYSEERFRATLRSVFGPAVSEGFFARKVVLVEGLEDKCVVEAALRAVGMEIEAEGIAVIAVEGKSCLDRPFGIFSALRIPCYVVFDGDVHRGKPDGKPEVNLALQSLCGEDHPEEFPETRVRDRYTVFNREITKDLPEELGSDRFLMVRDEVAREMGWTEDLSRAFKNAAVLEQVLRRLWGEGRQSEILNGLVDRVRLLA